MVISALRPPWPPDEVLELVGMTRAEWDDMEESVRLGRVREAVIERALAKSVVRRRNELARGE